MYINTSESFNSLITKAGRTFRARILLGDNVLEGLSNIKTSSGSNNGEALTLGSTISQMVEITMETPNVSLAGREFELQIGLKIGEDNYEYLPMGLFTPEKITNKQKRTSFTAYDRMMKLSGGYAAELPDETDTINVLNEISAKTGVPIKVTGLTAIPMKKPVGYTYREVLMYVAQMYGSFANVNREGTIELHFWEDAGYKLDADAGINGFASREDRFTVECLSCATGQDEEGNTVSISAGVGTKGITFSNPFMTQGVLNTVYEKIKGFSYIPVECPVILGDPRLDPWDLIEITDAEGITHKIPIMSLEFDYDGGLSCTITCTASEESEQTSDYKGPMAQFEERIVAQIAIIEALTAKKISVDELEAKVAAIGYLTAREADIKYAAIADLNATNASIISLNAQVATIEKAYISEARVEELIAAKGYVTSLGVGELLADYATIDNLNAEKARIDTLSAESLKAKDADLKYATIISLTATDANVTNLQADIARIDKAIIDVAHISDLTAINGSITNLTSKVAEIDQAYMDEAEVETLVVGKGYLTEAEVNTLIVNKGYFTEAQVENLVVEKGYITEASVNTLLSDYATIKQLDAFNADFNSLQSSVATIEKAYISTAQVNTLLADYLKTSTLESEVGKFGYLKATNLSSEVAKLGYLTVTDAKATYATITNLSATNANINSLTTRVGDISTLMFGSASGSSLTTEFSNSVIALIADATISSAKIVSLVADKITSGSLSTNKVSVKSDNGRLQITGDTILIKDASRTRVQIGKDANSDYNIYILDASGNIMFDATGIHADAIKSPIIEDSMVTEDANISASKLDIDSLFSEINGSSNTIKSTKIYLDDKKQTLDVAFSSVTTSVTDLGKTVTSHGTAISTIQGQISSKIWQQDVETAKTELDKDISTLSSQYSSLNQSLSGLSSTVAGHATQIEKKADSSTVTSVSNKVTTLEQNLSGFQTTVSNTYATKTEVSDVDTKASNAQSDISSLSTRVLQTENSILTQATDISSLGTQISAVIQTASDLTVSLQTTNTNVATALSRGVEYIEGTQTAPTNAWTGKTTDTSLVKGKTIAYKLPYAGNNSAATLNLTLAGGGTTGAKGIRRLDSTVTTNYAAGSVVHMTYDGTYWRITDYNSDTYDRVRYNKAIKCGTTAIVKANIIVGSSGVYKHLKAGTAFDVSYPILYAAEAISASATGTNNYLCYSFTVTTTQSITLTAYKPVYIKGTLSGTTFTPVSTSPLTQTVPTSNDGYYYILLGHAITSTTMYLMPEHPIYTYFDGSFKAVSQIAVEAAKTATNYLNVSPAGLVVGDMTASTLGKNVLICLDGVDIRNGSAVLASFQSDLIELGKNSITSEIKLCAAVGTISAYDDAGTSGDTLRLSSTGSLSLEGNNDVLLSAKQQGFLYLTKAYAMFDVPYISIGNIYKNYSGQASVPYLEWVTINSKTPYIGYASDQSDGTFVLGSLLGTNYASGLAIGGGSGNLLYKGKVVLHADNYTTYASPKSHASTATTYGIGTNANYGHVKLSDSTSTTSGTSAGIAATPTAVKSAYDLANTAKTNAAAAQAKADSAYALAGSKVGSLSDLGITATATELNYVDGVTSSIQTQLNGKAPTAHTHDKVTSGLGAFVAMYYDNATNKNHWFKPDTSYPTSQEINLGSSSTRTWDNIYAGKEVYINGTGVKSTLDTLSTRTTDSGWKNLSPSAGTWTVLRYRKIGNKVTIQGHASAVAWTGSSGMALATIPSGYRPSGVQVYALGNIGGKRLAKVGVTTGGNLFLDYMCNISDGSNYTTSTWLNFTIEYYV